MQLHRARKDFDESGARLVAIGQRGPEDAKEFMRALKVDLPIYTSRDRAAYRAAGTKIGTLGELLGPKSVLKGLRRTASDKVHQGKIVGHAAQLGGVMVVKPDQSITYAHLSEDASDIPPNDEVLAAARAAAD